MQNVGLDESQASIKITGKNINNLKICRWYHSNGRKQRTTKEPLDEGQKVKVKVIHRVQLFVTPWAAACQASLSNTSFRSPPKLMSIELVMPSNHLIFYCSLLLSPSIFPMVMGESFMVFLSESVLHLRWPKYWSFSFSISPSNEHPGLISFRIDWLDLLAVQGTLKSLLQHHSSKVSIL